MSKKPKHKLTKVEEETIKMSLRVSSDPTSIRPIARAYAEQGVTKKLLARWWWELRNGTQPFLPSAFDKSVPL